MRVQRHFMRWQVNRDVQVRIPEVADSFMKATIHDISMMGMQVSLDRELPRDKAFPLTVRLPDGEHLHMEPWVAWHTEEDNEQVYGLYFTRIQDHEKEKICNFINDIRSDEIAVNRFQSCDTDAAKDTAADRRIFQRFPMHCPLFLSVAAEEEKHKAETVDFSARGVGFTLRDWVEPTSRVRVWIEFPSLGGPFYAPGTLVWIKPVAAGAYRAGVELDSADLMGMTGLLKA
ncbi:MAG: PilZ domain-containing protein [Candidatus Omnitrophica bacterium]|nr:PilZ domain-containing protein [Candidatus Omnitrophota bacterium]